MPIKELKYKVPQIHHRVMCLCLLPVLTVGGGGAFGHVGTQAHVHVCACCEQGTSMAQRELSLQISVPHN